MLPAILLIMVGGAVATLVITITTYLAVRSARQVIVEGAHQGFLLSDGYFYMQLVLAGLIVGLPLLAVRSSNFVVPVLAAIAAFVALRIGFVLGTLLYYAGDHVGDIISSAFKDMPVRELITPVVALLAAGVGTLLGMSRGPSAGPAMGMPAPGGPAMAPAPGAPMMGAPGAPGAPQWGAPQPPPPAGQPFSTQPPGQTGGQPFGAAPGFAPPQQAPSGPYAQPTPGAVPPPPAAPAAPAAPQAAPAPAPAPAPSEKDAPKTMLDASRTMFDSAPAKPADEDAPKASPMTQLDQPLPETSEKKDD
ncbi:hypothetical protein [Actinomadura oligospora]|uniref:hypothetical protein n=1 Tax=Actinomadura oligospora TaxID=111804 RepID=UPI0004B0D652|nr:hypothetical protein [Actinomadura oligospora]